MKHDRQYHGGVERLRSPERLGLLDVDRVVNLSLQGIGAKEMLDVGTGSAIFAEAFARQGLTAAGVDANPEMVEAASRFVPQGEFRLAPAEALPYPDGSFDLVFMGVVLHEADDPLKALQEARRVARLRVAVLEWPATEDSHGPPMADRLTPERVHSLAGEAGFVQISTHQLPHVNLFLMEVGAGIPD
ncbi:MAG: class I SAM-dependent methyltransferase [Chloroflexi bacterium]|nr:class I SAM-dependent methyltransferase [Chloroflexota bacterium]